MAAELFSPPSRALDANANPYSGAKWYFYATNSSTPQAVYTTSALNVAHTNPVVADSGGKFAAIYFDSSLVYRGVLKDSAGAVTLHDIDPINNTLETSGGSDQIGFIQAGTGAVARTVQSKLRDVINARDFDTLQHWINRVALVNGIGVLSAGTYAVGELTATGSDFRLEFEPGVVLAQNSGLTGDADWHSIITIDGDNIELSGKIAFTGNITTDHDEYSPCVRVVSGSTGIKLGSLYGTNIRGDVLYVEGKTADTLTDVYVDRVSGSNVYRTLVAVVGGSLTFGEIIHDGAVGYVDLLLEPNAGGLYHPSSAVGRLVRGGVVGVVSADTALQNDNFAVETIDLDGSRIADSTPAYPSAPGANAIALPLSYVRSVNIGLLKLRGYASYPVSLASNWDSIRIGTLDVATCNQTETTFNSIIVQQGTPGNGLLDVGYVKCVHTANSKWLFRSDTAGLKVRVGAGSVSGGKLSVCCVLDITGMVLNAGGASGGTANLVVNGPLSNIRNLSLSNAASATLLHSSSNCKLTGITGTVNFLVAGASNNNSIDASNINGADISGQTLSSDAPSTVTAAATITLPQDRNEVVITGNTNITSIAADAHTIRRVVTLQFTGTPTVVDGSNLALAGNFVATADDTLTLRGDGASWTEVARSTN